jgi:hypothetical protein
MRCQTALPRPLDLPNSVCVGPVGMVPSPGYPSRTRPGLPPWRLGRFMEPCSQIRCKRSQDPPTVRTVMYLRTFYTDVNSSVCKIRQLKSLGDPQAEVRRQRLSRRVQQPDFRGSLLSLKVTFERESHLWEKCHAETPTVMRLSYDL